MTWSVRMGKFSAVLCDTGVGNSEVGGLTVGQIGRAVHEANTRAGNETHSKDSFLFISIHPQAEQITVYPSTEGTLCLCTFSLLYMKPKIHNHLISPSFPSSHILAFILPGPRSRINHQLCCHLRASSFLFFSLEISHDDITH